MISFIIPAYNAEKTIEHTINSIINQKESLLDYELIIINDGSKDETDKSIKKIIDKNKIDEIKYNEKDYFTTLKCNNKKINFYYYEQENRGVAVARNFAIKKANGDYIIFVDSDDYISESLLKDIEEYILKDVEIIKWNPIFVEENGKVIKKETNFSFEKMSGIDGFNFLYGKDKLISCLWNYAIKKYLIPEFPKVMYHEDFGVIPIIILNARSMVSIPKYEYYYVQTRNSIMRGNNEEKQRRKIDDMLFNYDNILEQTKKLNLDKFTNENLKIFLTNSLLVILPELSGDNKKYFISELGKRKVSKNLKARNLKQLLKKCFYTFKGI